MEWIEILFGFVTVFGCGLGVYLYGVWAGKQTGKPLGFWANGESLDPGSVADIPGYNRCYGKLFRGYAVPFMLAGILLIRFAVVSLILLLVWGAFGTWWLIRSYKRMEKQFILR